MKEPNCKECPFGNEPQVYGLGSRTEGTKLLAIRDDRPFDLVVVAMAPAEEEMRQKMPMVGPSGQYLRRTLYQLGVIDYYTTNCLLCPIPYGAEDAQVREALACCRSRLEDEVVGRHPKLILALGDMPLTEFCGGDYGILETAGRLLMSRLNIPLVPVAHPAFYLRRPEDAFDFLECTRAGIRYLNNNYHQVGDVTRTLVTEENLKEVLEDLEKHDELSLDLETSGFHALGLAPDAILEMGLAYNGQHAYIVPNNLIPHFKKLIETKKIDGWNIFFDARFLKALGITPNIYFDGMLAHYCLDERQYSHGLKKVARIYLGADDWEKAIKVHLKNPKKDSYALLPTDVRQEYLSKDACYTNELKGLLREEVKDNWAFWNILMPATRVFTETTFRGFPVDPYKIAEMHKLLWDEINRDERKLWDMTGRVFNPSSPVEVARILYDDLRIPMHPKYGRSTNKKLLEDWRSEYPLVDRIVLHREMRHDVQNYVEGFARRIDRNFCIHPTIRMFGTVTGRISSEDPSIMNVKRDSRVKEIFIANEGRLLAEFDLRGAELRWYYMYSEDEVLRDVLTYGFQGELGVELTDEQRKDPHYIIGAIAYGVERADELRAPAKMTVFGRLYLRGLASIEAQYGREIARRLVDAMDEIIPKHKNYTTTIRKQVHTHGYVESYFERQRRFPLVTSENRSEVERQAVNMPIQSAASDLNLLNLIYLWENRHRWDIFPMFTVHDSIMVEIPSPDVLPEIKKGLEDNAYEIVRHKIPFPYDVKYGKSWGSMEKLHA